jgi:hypothetical protein
MYEKIEIAKNLYAVISEPGDGTHYNYIILKDHDDYFIMPAYKTFRYPQQLNYYDIEYISEVDLLKLAEKENCNPYTLMEVIRTIKLLQNNK